MLNFVQKNGMNFIWVFVGGGLGSMARYAISLGAQKFYVGNFPIATFISNLIACMILGLVAYTFKEKFDSSDWISPLIITGFCGGFSTFSTWSKETLDLIQQGQWFWAITNCVVSIAVGIGLLFWLKATSSH